MAKTRRTYQPHKIHRIKTHGFRARMETVGGRRVLKNRRLKQRATLTVSDEIRQDKQKRISRIRK